jgi:hypothetical protein
MFCNSGHLFSWFRKKGIGMIKTIFDPFPKTVIDFCDRCINLVMRGLIKMLTGITMVNDPSVPNPYTQLVISLCHVAMYM